MIALKVTMASGEALVFHNITDFQLGDKALVMVIDGQYTIVPVPQIKFIQQAINPDEGARDEKEEKTPTKKPGSTRPNRFEGVQDESLLVEEEKEFEEEKA